MDKLTEGLRLIHEKAIKGQGAWPVGAKEAFIFNDAVIVYFMDEGRKLKIDIIAGVPIKFDMDLELLEKEERNDG